MKMRYPLSVIFVLLTLLGCSDPRPATPMCRTSTSFSDAHATAAGCVIRIDNAVLMIRHRLTGRLDIPGGGHQDDESLACTAHRETWEETGLNVEVGRVVGKTTHGMILFDCSEHAGLTSLSSPFNAPDWAKSEVSELVIANLYNLSGDALRYHDDLVPLRDAYIQSLQHKHKTQQ